ncbi:GNAT family N-acetyltransferase [Sporosarcina sp. ITBMC105]
MNILITPPRNRQALAAFLEEMNTDQTKHVGYCGNVKEEIYDTISTDFSDLDVDQSFAVAYQHDRIVGAIGLDIDEEDLSAEVWGPFISDVADQSSVAEELWRKVLEFSGLQLSNFYFFLSKENRFGQQFALAHGGVENGHHSILLAKKSDKRDVDGSGIQLYMSKDYQDFKELHEREFPSTYFNAEQIINRLSDTHKLFIARTSDGKMQGYVYVEAQPTHHEGSIEYIAISNDFRKQGLGTKLLTFAMQELFQHDTIEEISLCVESANEQALKLYQAAGFEVLHELISYKINRFSGVVLR